MRKFRYMVQGLFLALMAYIAIKHQILRAGAEKLPPLDSVCPFGAVAAAYTFLTSGSFIPRIGYSNFVIFFGLIIMGVVLKSGFCGWVCPFGTIQEWIGNLGKKIFKGRKFIPDKVDKYGRYVKYLILALIILLTALTGTLVFRAYDPFLAFFHMGFGNLPGTAYLVLAIVLIGSLFVFRFWCRYFCPLAVIVGLLGKLGIYKIECENEKCIECGQCEKLCPMDIKIAKQGRISTVECNSCLNCLEAEDVHDAICLKAPATKKRLLPVYYPVILLAIFFGVIFSSQSLGWWTEGEGPKKGLNRKIRLSKAVVPQVKDSLKTSQKKRSKKETTEEDERIVQVGENEIEIQGNMSFYDIQKLTGVPSDYLINKLSLPDKVSKTENLGNLKKTYSFDMDDVRNHIRAYLGLKQVESEMRRKSGQEDKETTAKEDERYIEIDGKKIEIMGYMSLNEVERLTGVPVNYLIRNLNLPQNISTNENLGRLRRKYGFQMQDLRKHIREYLKR